MTVGCDFDWGDKPCAHCGAVRADLSADWQEDLPDGEMPGYVCPRCGRHGCLICMPGGKRCLCPECDEGEE
jgi:hypothetical protein